MTCQEAEVLLKKQFKPDRFYDTQWEVIQKILKGIIKSQIAATSSPLKMSLRR
jgi:hypothetical protein